MEDNYVMSIGPKEQAVRGIPVGRLNKLEQEVANLIAHPGGSPGGNVNDVQTNDGMGGFTGDDGFQYQSKQVTIDGGPAPVQEQLKLKADGLGGLGLLNYGPGDQEILLDVDWTGTDYIATNTVVGSIRATDSGMDFFENTGQTVGSSANLGPSRIRITPTGEVGVNQSNPQAYLHVTPAFYTIPSNFTSSAIPSATGYSFGSGDKDYDLAAEDSSIPVFTALVTNHFVEPSSSAFDPSGGSASFNTGSGGYTASGYDFSYNIWAIYGGSTLISLGNVGTNSTGTDPNDGSTYGVDVSWSAPSSGVPDSYLIQAQGSNPNSGSYQVISGTSFTDQNSGWTTSASYSPLGYIVNLSWTPATGPNVTGYVLFNATNSSQNSTGATTINDDGLWNPGQPNVSPEGQTETAIFDGPNIAINGIDYIWPFSLTAGFFKIDGGGNISFVTLGPSDITGLTNDEILYAESGTIAQSPLFKFNGTSLMLGTAGNSTIDFGISRFTDGSSSGTLNNYNTSGISNLALSFSSTFTGFAGGYDGKLIMVLNNSKTYKNNDSGSSAGNKFATPNGGDYTPSVLNSSALWFYDNNAGVWKSLNPDYTQIANTWTKNQAFNAVNLTTDTTTGTKIGTATTQKWGFFNATPIVQPGATTELGVVLSNLGFRATGTAYPITTSGAITLGSLTATRLVFSGTAGLLSDNAGLTFASSILTVPDMIDSGLTASKFVLTDGSKKLVSGTAALQIAAGIPTIVASTFEKAETSTDANILTYTTGGADEYLVLQGSIDISALAGTSVTLKVTWTDSNNTSQTSSVVLTGVSDGTINIPVNAKTATTVVFATTAVALVSTAYNVSAFITRLK